jgi:hypothetical protein
MESELSDERMSKGLNNVQLSLFSPLDVKNPFDLGYRANRISKVVRSDIP